jgi:hypothetical protein
MCNLKLFEPRSTAASMRVNLPYVSAKPLIICACYDGLMTKPAKVAKSLRIGLSGNSSTYVIKLKKNIHTIAVGIQEMQERCVFSHPECAGLSTGDLHEEDYHHD